jgi:hypothetical protein
MSRIHLAAALFVAVLLGPDIASADRIVHIPGTGCSPRKSDVGKINYGDDLGVINEDSSSAKVACPIFYESDSGMHASGEQNHPNDIFIRVLDRSSSASGGTGTSSKIYCDVFGFLDDDIGSPIFQKRADKKSILDPANIVTEITHLDDQGVLIVESPGLVYTMTCTIPGASSSSKRSEILDYQLAPTRFKFP